MDITTTSNSKPDKSDKNTTTTFKGKGTTKQQSSFALNGIGAHTLDSARVIPDQMQSVLVGFLGKYGFPLDLNQSWVKQLTPDKVKAIRQIGEQAQQNAKFLPIVITALKKAMKAEVSEAKAKKEIVAAAAACGYAIDKEQAEAFLILTNYQQKQKRLEKRIQTLVGLKEKRTQAYEAYYENSVAGTQGRIIDAEFEVMGESQKILEGSKTKRLEFKQKQAQSAAEYYNQAFE